MMMFLADGYSRLMEMADLPMNQKDQASGQQLFRYDPFKF